MEIAEIEALKGRMSQQARAGLPFNPLAEPITGANVDRLQLGMEEFGWKDHRFVTAEQAQMNGWKISHEANSVQVTARDVTSGAVVKTPLFNASNVIGMPSLEEMLQMDEQAFLALRGIEAPVLAPAAELETKIDDASPELEEAEPSPANETDLVHVQEPEHEPEISPNEVQAEYLQTQAEDELDDDDIEVGPALQPEIVQDPEIEAVVPEHTAPGELTDLFLDEPVTDLGQGTVAQEPGIDWSDEPEPTPDHFAVTAEYWLDGLHNFEGIKRAEEINRVIAQKKLSQNKDGVEDLLATYPEKAKFGLKVVEREKHEKDPQRKANQAEPSTLLKGALVRDAEGKYRPKEGGTPIIEDKGTSLKLKRKNGKAYEAAMELALAKGWKAIELNGKPNMLGQAWLEAKMKGLEVVNYNPTEKDREKLAQRIAERDAALAKEQSSETVELRPVLDADGREVMAKVTSTVDQQPLSGKQGEALAQGKPVQQTVVTRTTTRVADVVRSDVQPGVVPKGTRTNKPSKGIVDREVAEAVAEAKEEEVGVFDMGKGGRLIAHGPAPFHHNPNEKASYFATVENEAGKSHTVWGVDLPRSLDEAGAQIGDTVSLIGGERRPVTVPTVVNGVKTEISVNRVTWETTIHEKAKAVQAPAAVQIQVADKGMHIGPVVAIKDGMIGQKTGRDPNKLVWHEISKLQGKVPAIGEMAEIGYANGQGKVKEQAQERAMER